MSEKLYEEAYLAFNQHDYSLAASLFAKLVALEPLVSKYWKGIAASFQMEKKFEEALKGWSMLSLLEASSPEPHFHAAECFLALKQKEEGLKALELAKNRASSDIIWDQKIKELRIHYDCICT